jgi:hypothetical protein
VDKTPGQLAYEADLANRRTYADGSLRPCWENLNKYAKMSWEANPTPKGA